MTNVVSFHVRVLQSSAPVNGQRTYGADFVEVGNPAARAANFDTAVSTTAGNAGTTFFVSAIAVSLRVWDQKTRQTRQITVVQDM
jgi:hypothetical protein